MAFKKKLFNKIIVSGLVFTSISLSSVSGSHIITDISKEIINGHSFVTQKENKDGILTEKWEIDGQNVIFSMFKSAKADMVKEALEKNRKEAIEKAEDMLELKKMAAKRLITVAFDKIKEEIRRIQEYELESMLAWNNETIQSQEEYNRISREIEKSIRIPNDLEKVRIYAKQLEAITNKLNKLFFDTVKHVVTHTTDTKILKRLMELL